MCSFYRTALTSERVADGLRVIAPCVSRHFDFLESLVEDKRLPVDPAVLRAAGPAITFVVG